MATLYVFSMPQASLYDYGDLAGYVQDTHKRAAAGDPRSEALYGTMLAGLPQLDRTYDQALRWFLKAAQAGVAYAQYQVGTALMQGKGCDCDTAKGEIWLEKAAQADEPDAEVSLADYLLRGQPKAHDVSTAMMWLERAVKQGNEYGKLRLAGILASSPIPGLADPKRAVGLTGQVDYDYGEDPSLGEIEAAAQASRGDFDKARREEANAIRLATRLGWDLSPLERRASQYAAAKPWVGDVLQF